MRVSKLIGAAALIWVAWATSSMAAEPARCRTVRFADVGWSDITATTAVASNVLKGLGYVPEVNILSVPIT